MLMGTAGNQPTRNRKRKGEREREGVIEMEVMSPLGCTATVTEVQPSVWDKIAF